MLMYDDLVDELEDAWIGCGLHEHELTESILPDSHDRAYRVALFPDHPEPLTEENTPPWVEISFTWSASHQLCSEGRHIDTEPLFLSWTYNVLIRDAMLQRNDHELVHLFHQALKKAIQSFMPEAAGEPQQIAVEIRRIYQSEGQSIQLAHMQLVSTNITDLTEQWRQHNATTLRHLVHMEVQLASAVIYALTEKFSPGGPGSYQTAQTA